MLWQLFLWHISCVTCEECSLEESWFFYLFFCRIHKNDCSYKTAGNILWGSSIFVQSTKNTFRMIHYVNAFQKCTRTSKLSFFFQLGLWPYFFCGMDLYAFQMYSTCQFCEMHRWISLSLVQLASCSSPSSSYFIFITLSTSLKNKMAKPLSQRQKSDFYCDFKNFISPLVYLSV